MERRRREAGCAPAVAHAAQPPRRFYVSLDDSYAPGWQPTGVGQGRNTRNGFAYQVPRLSARARELRVWWRCHDVAHQDAGLSAGGLGPGGRAYPRRTQLAVAERFLRAYRRRTALVSVSIGGNDVTACVGKADPVACVATAATTIERT
jgi:hypothetical protein